MIKENDVKLWCLGSEYINRKIQTEAQKKDSQWCFVIHFIAQRT